MKRWKLKALLLALAAAAVLGLLALGVPSWATFLIGVAFGGLASVGGEAFGR